MRRLYGVMVDEDVIKKLPGNGSGYTAEEIEAMATRVIPTYRVKQDMIDYAKKIYNKQHNRLVELNFEKGLDPDGNEIRVQGRLICRKVFGISVDKETFDQYQQKRYQVCDKNFPMNIVEIYANSKEIETELPEMSKAAKKIINEATKEINTKFGYKNISEEGKNMKKNHLSDYLKEMQKLRDEAAMRTQEIDEHLREEQEKYSEVTGINEAKLNELERTEARSRYLRAKETHDTESANLRKKVQKTLDNLQEDFYAQVEERYRAKSSDLDDGVIKLLHSGIQLSENELYGLLDDAKYNPTMTRLISDHIINNMIGNKDVSKDSKLRPLREKAFLCKKAASGKEYRQMFDSLRSWTEKNYATSGSGFSEQYNQLLEKSILIFDAYEGVEHKKINLEDRLPEESEE